jgi:hypothetical protein
LSNNLKKSKNENKKITTFSAKLFFSKKKNSAKNAKHEFEIQ